MNLFYWWASIKGTRVALAFIRTEVSKAAGLKMEGTSERIIRVNDKIEFIGKDVPIIILKVLGKRGEGIV
jgi:hypothetical protein